MTMAFRKQENDRLYQICRALANPVRIQIVRFVRANPGCHGSDILGQLPADVARAQSTLSQHLKVLCDARVLEAQANGAAVKYWLNVDAFDWLREQLDELQHEPTLTHLA